MTARRVVRTAMPKYPYLCSCMIRKVLIAASLLLSLLSISARAQVADVIAGCNFDSGAIEPVAVLQAYGADPFGDTYARANFSWKLDPLSLDFAHLEIARTLVFWKGTIFEDIGLHAEFNGFMNMGNSNWLFGLDYTLPMKDLVKISVLYKTFNGGAVSTVPVQLSVLWDLKDIFGLSGLEFRGDFKAWGEKTTYWFNEPEPLTPGPAYFKIKTTPQLWYSVGQFFGWNGLSVGGEMELGYNYLGSSGLSVSPMAAVRFSF